MTKIDTIRQIDYDIEKLHKKKARLTSGIPSLFSEGTIVLYNGKKYSGMLVYDGELRGRKVLKNGDSSVNNYRLISWCLTKVYEW